MRPKKKRSKKKRHSIAQQLTPQQLVAKVTVRVADLFRYRGNLAAALLLSAIRYWMLSNQKKSVNKINNTQYWFTSYAKLCQVYPFISKNTFCRAIELLEEDGMIHRDSYRQGVRGGHCMNLTLTTKYVDRAENEEGLSSELDELRLIVRTL